MTLSEKNEETANRERTFSGLGDIHDPDLLHQFRKLDQLDDDTRGKTRFLLDALLTQQQINKLAAKGESRR